MIGKETSDYNIHFQRPSFTKCMSADLQNMAAQTSIVPKKENFPVSWKRFLTWWIWESLQSNCFPYLNLMSRMRRKDCLIIGGIVLFPSLPRIRDTVLPISHSTYWMNSGIW